MRRAARNSVRSRARVEVTIPRQKFEPHRRLHLPAEFTEIKRRGRRFGDALFSLSVLANQKTHARLGLSIATRIFGTAVARNRIKRLTRESFRLNQHRLPPVDIAVYAREGARLAKLADLRASLERHWQSIQEKC